MIKQIYCLQVLYANNWVDIEKFASQDRAVMAAKPYVDKGTYSEVQVLEISFDTETKQIVESWPIDLDYFLEQAKSENKRTKNRGA